MFATLGLTAAAAPKSTDFGSGSTAAGGEGKSNDL